MDDNVNSGGTRYLDKDGKELTEADLSLQAGKTATGKKGNKEVGDDRSENAVSSKA